MTDIHSRLERGFRAFAGDSPPPPSVDRLLERGAHPTNSHWIGTHKAAVVSAGAAVLLVSLWVVATTNRPSNKVFRSVGARSGQDEGGAASTGDTRAGISLNPSPTPAAGPVTANWVQSHVPDPPVPWSSGTEPTVTVAGHSLVTLGHTSEGVLAQVYDASSNVWTASSRVPDLPLGAIGGNAPGAWTGQEVVYPGASFDPASGNWSVQHGFDPDPNLQRWWAIWTGTTVVYLPGGQSFVPATDTWGLLSNVPLGLRGAVPIWTGETILTSDGEGWFQYSPISGRWQVLPGGPSDTTLMSTARDGSGVEVFAKSGLYRVDLSTARWTFEHSSPFGSCIDTHWLLRAESYLAVASASCGVAARTSNDSQLVPIPTLSTLQLSCPVTIGLAIADLCSNDLIMPQSR